MATWSAIKTFTDDGGYALNVTDGAGKLYYVIDAGSRDDVFEYDIATDTETQISNAASFSDFPNPFLNIGQEPLIWFKGSLYAVVTDSGENPPLRVYRWSGSGTTWSNVFAASGLTVLATNPSFPRIAKSDNHLLVMRAIVDTSGGTTNPPSEVDLWYSADGTTWAAGTYDNTPAVPTQFSIFGLTPHGQNNPALGIWALLTCQFGGVSPPSALYKIMKWNEGSTTLETEFHYKKEGGVYVSGDDWVFNDYDGKDHVFWADGAGTGFVDWFEYPTLTGAFGAPSSGDFVRFQNGFIGFPASVAPVHDTDGSDRIFHLMTAATGVLDAGEVVTTSSRTFYRAIRMDNGDAYLILKSPSGGTSYELWARSEPLFPPAAGGECRFYQGADTLVYRSDLPFTGLINPAAMAVRGDRVVAIGGQAAGDADEIIVRGTEEDIYAAWADVTGTLTGVPINGLAWVNGEEAT